MFEEKMNLVGHVAHFGKLKMDANIYYECLKEKDRLRELGIDGKIILEWISNV
jgi:hypothetical protein